jgi:multicomponent Na+:H+ antiporter subunit E
MAADRLAWFIRGAGFLILWVILAGFHAGDIPAAVVAVIAATWTSLLLLPPATGRASLAGIARLLLRFPAQSVLAGVDVARRAFDPRLPLRPGFVTVAPRLKPGLARDAFTAYASLLPGTLPAAANADGTLLVHCLDTTQAAAAQLAAEEAAFIRAIGAAGDV